MKSFSTDFSVSVPDCDDSGRVVGKQEVTKNGFSHPLEDADPDTPILKQAKAEYAKLQ